MRRQRHPLEGKHEATLHRVHGRWIAQLAGGATVPLDTGPNEPREGRTRIIIESIEGSPVARLPHRSWRHSAADRATGAAEAEAATVVPEAVAPQRSRYVVPPSGVIAAGDRVAVFVDSANLDGACRQLGLALQYDALLRFLVGPGRLVAAFYYLITTTPDDSRTRRFLDFLSHSGYTPRCKKPKEIRDTDSGAVVVKGNVDSDMIVDMLTTAPTWDVAWLLSGDSTFEPAIVYLRGQGKRILVLTSDRTISRELAHNANPPVFLLEDHAPVFAKPKGTATEPPG